MYLCPKAVFGAEEGNAAKGKVWLPGVEMSKNVLVSSGKKLVKRQTLWYNFLKNCNFSWKGFAYDLFG